MAAGRQATPKKRRFLLSREQFPKEYRQDKKKKRRQLLQQESDGRGTEDEQMQWYGSILGLVSSATQANKNNTCIRAVGSIDKAGC